MKLRPILFSTPMVLALLAGIKTQTRRIIKPQPIDDTENSGYVFSGDHETAYRNDMHHAPWQERFTIHSKYEVGDVLWVRETYHELDPVHVGTGESKYVYRTECVDDFNDAYRLDYIKQGFPYQWKPSIFMPFDACRLFLELVSIRVERLNEISEEDALAEGVARTQVTYACSGASTSLRFQDYKQRYDIHHPMHKWCHSAKHSYQTLWKKINGPDSVAANPFVWVYEFKQVKKPII